MDLRLPSLTPAPPEGDAAPTPFTAAQLGATMRLAGLASGLYAVWFFAGGAWRAALVQAIASLAFVAASKATMGGPGNRAIHLVCALFFVDTVATAEAISYFWKGSLVWLVLQVLVAGLLLNMRGALTWTALGGAAWALLALQEAFDVILRPDQALRGWFLTWHPVVNFASLMVCVAAFVVAFKRALENARRQAQASYLQAHRAERMASLGTMVAGVAHEVNNPLTYVIGNLGTLHELLRDPATLDEPSRRALALAMAADAAEGAERVRVLVNQLRRFARGEHDANVPVKLREVVDSALRFTGHQLRTVARLEDQVTHDVVVPGGMAVTQVLMNLLINAAQAMRGHPAPPGGHVVRVTSLPAGADRVELLVDDTGPGVPGHLRARVFEPFFSTKEVGEGTGLGLAICQETVTRLGGAMDVTPAPGGGARFSVVLPVLQLAGESITPKGVDLSGFALPPPSGVRHRILLVDDEPKVLSALARLFPDQDVTTAANAEEALAELHKGAFGLVLCDVMMPGTSGPQLLERIRVEFPEMARRTVLMTGGAADGQMQSLAGAPVLHKPISSQDVMRLLESPLLAPAPREGDAREA